MRPRTSFMVAAFAAVALFGCSDPEDGPGVLPENMAEENLPAIDTVQENRMDVDVTAADVGNDAVAVPVEPRP